MGSFIRIRNISSRIGISLILVMLSIAPLIMLNANKASAATTPPSYRYTKSFDVSNGRAQGEYVATDKNNNIYVYGNFNGTVIFNPADPSTSVTTPATQSSYNNIFLTKYNSTGAYQWTKTLDVSEGSYASSGGVKTDSSGNVIITGSIYGTVSLPGINGFNVALPTPNVIPNTTFGNSDSSFKPSITTTNSTSFLIKFDGSGDTQWSNTADSGSGFIDSTNISIDSNDNTYITGSFEGTVNFTTSDQFTSQNSTSFIAKYNSSGNFQSLIYTDTTNGRSDGFGTTVDKNGNIYMSGTFNGEVGFNYNGTDPGTDIYTNPHPWAAGKGVEGFVSKYDNSGNYLWTKINAIQNDNDTNYIYNLITDSKNNLYMSGYFIGVVNFNNDPNNQLTSTDNVADGSSAITKYDNNGNYLWTRITTNSPSSNSNNESAGISITLDAQNNIYTSGYFYGSMLLDGPAGSAEYTFQSNDFRASNYLTKFSSDGVYQYSKVFTFDSGSANFPVSNGIGWSLALDNLGNIYGTGGFTGPAYFNGINNTDENDSANENSFLTSWNLNALNIVTPNTPNTGFAKDNNTNKLVLLSCLLIALLLFVGGNIVRVKIGRKIHD